MPERFHGERLARPSLNYGQAIERLRKERRMTREALAEASGVSPSYLSEVERGFKRPSVDVLAKIAKAFEMLPSRLLEYVESLAVTAPSPAVPIEPPADRGELMTLGTRFESAGAPPARGPRDDALEALMAVAQRLDKEDLRILVDLARRLLAKAR